MTVNSRTNDERMIKTRSLYVLTEACDLLLHEWPRPGLNRRYRLESADQPFILHFEHNGIFALRYRSEPLS